ncbi:uncharacterized protein LOC128740603 [Sabethes cyaneus]|uniref:uncharacterized protein LOC128740603 n=1 Tax=Sabethes cyaneus TaxID=53552 RepID=UPI00237DCC08|nr:uncharacterized protein LOC128740603 [Sabethes cyaneus]
MRFAKYLVILWCSINCGHGQEPSSPLMLSNERVTLDDCHLRFHKLVAYPLPKPAFGHPARLKEFAHIGAVGWTLPNGTVSWKCGGTLIWDNFVLTAAHCAVDLSGKRPDVIRFGDLNIYSSDDDEYAQQLNIIDVIRHPDHRYVAQYHDIALLKLEKNVTLHDTVVPACLWTDREVRFKTLEAAGWGKTGFAEEQTPVLLKVSLKPIDNEECSKIYTNDTNRKLRLGLQDHHICAVDEKMDTCEGDSGGPLQIKLMHNGRVTPFLVGVTSFGTICGTSSPGVYTKVASYQDWIVDTMRSHGAFVNETTYNATFCALRYVHFREYEDAVITSRTDTYVLTDTSLRHMQEVERLPSYMVKLAWRTGAGREDCYGAIIDETSVLTLAQCVYYNREPVSHILYLGDKEMNVSKFDIHPEYIPESGYNNIAILHTKHFLDIHQIQPACIWHEQKIPFDEVHIFGSGREDINTFWPESRKLIDPTITFLRPRLFVQNSTACAIPNRFESKLETGLKREHVCVGKDFFLVPKSCDLLVGGSIDGSVWREGNDYPTTFGLVQFGRDCGFGEHSVATGFANHIDWLKSLLLSDHTEKGGTFHFLDDDLHEGDTCTSDDNGKAGLCVAVSKCPRQWKKFLSTGNAQFCSTSSVICCPHDAMDGVSDTHPAIASCPNVVRNIKSKKPGGSLVLVGWFEEDFIRFKCLGTILTRNVVLTTASCFGKVKPDVIKLISNETDSVLQVKATLKHNAYNAVDNSNDIGIIWLTDRLQWNSDVYPSCLWTNRTHTPLVMDMVLPVKFDHVGYVRVLAMYNSDCQRTNSYKLPESQLCVRDPFEKPTCLDPFSALLWVRGDGVAFTVGLSTILPDCNERDYMIFTRFSAYSQWIGDALRDAVFNSGDNSTLLMLPNERLSLDDCHLRFHRFSLHSEAAPASADPARLKEFAHIGAIGWTLPNGTVLWSCGGTLIWNNFVLTAAHCAIDDRGKRPDVIRFGDLNIYSAEDDEYAQQFKIIDVIRHPKHRFVAQYHDIALMKLEKNVRLHDTVVPACLWTDEEIRFKTLEAAGWGQIGYAQEQTPILLKVRLKPIGNEECGKIYTNETNRKLRDGLQDHHTCAVDEKMDTCEGDSGGPLQVKLMHNGRVTPFLVGITSFGTICGTSSPGVYTKVAPYHDWIVETMRSHRAVVNENTYNATFCALRYVHFREYEDAIITARTDSYVLTDTTLHHMEAAESLPSYMVKLAWRSGDGHDDCYGAIIDETTVLTLAQCVFHNR